MAVQLSHAVRVKAVANLLGSDSLIGSSLNASSRFSGPFFYGLLPLAIGAVRSVSYRIRVQQVLLDNSYSGPKPPKGRTVLRAPSAVIVPMYTASALAEHQ